MNLYVDIGNSRLKWLLESAGIDVASGAGSLEELEPLVRSIKQALEAPRVLSSDLRHASDNLERILVSSVAGESVNADFYRLCHSAFNLQPHYISVEKTYGGVTIAYSDVSTLGVDRWLAMLAARKLADSSCLVIDAGSAITVDLLDDEGVHVGGMIAPGLNTLSGSLKTNTTKVAFDSSVVYMSSLGVREAGIPLGLGRSTSECVSAGIQGMFDGFLTHIVSSLHKQFDSVLVAGGDTARVMSLLETIFLGAVNDTGSLQGDDSGVDCSSELNSKGLLSCPDLVMEGLRCWCTLNLRL